MATELQKEVTTPQKQSSTCWQQCQVPGPRRVADGSRGPGTLCWAQPWLGSPCLDDAKAHLGRQSLCVSY